MLIKYSDNQELYIIKNIYLFKIEKNFTEKTMIEKSDSNDESMTLTLVKKKSKITASQRVKTNYYCVGGGKIFSTTNLNADKPFQNYRQSFCKSK